MKIKKKELRRGMAQLPINYPDPEVMPDALPGGVLDMDAEIVQVELICKRLAHNEVVVRDAALAEVPRYLARLTKVVAEMEAEYEGEIASVTAYFRAHPKAPNPYKYGNIPLALFEYRQRAHQEDQLQRRRQAVRELKRQRKEAKLAKTNYGRYGSAVATTAPGSNDNSEHDEDGEDDEMAESGAEKGTSSNEHKAKYTEWMQTWCDAELIFLKLARGLHFCLWHSDKPLVQLACAQRIADLIDCPATTRCKVLFYGSLFRVLAREWPTIDRYRMDKYLALARRMLLAWTLLVKHTAAAEAEEMKAGVPPTTANGAAAKEEEAETSGKRKASPTKKGKAVAKRSRAKVEVEDEVKEAAAGAEEDAYDSPLAHTAKGTPEMYVCQYFRHMPKLSETLREIFYVLQVQIIPNSTSVGLTMHLCDVAFDELTKAYLPVPLFVTLAAGIPFYAMSQGNFVEKRVLDSFFPPLAGGVFTSRRAAQILETLKRNQKKQKKSTKLKAREPAAAALSAEELAGESERLAAMDNDAVLAEMAHCCQVFSVSRGTARAVRVMFSEAELVLQQSRNPDAYKSLTRTAQRRRLEHEIEEVNETRAQVREARTQKRESKQAERRGAIHEKVQSRKAALLKVRKGKDQQEDGGEVDIDEKALTKAVVEEEKASKVKKLPRDTKRKKSYRLTKDDLYGDHDSEDEK